MSEEDPLDDLIQKVDKAEEHGQELTEKQKRQQEIKNNLRSYTMKLKDDEAISEVQADAILELVEEAEYGEARTLIEDSRDRSDSWTPSEKNIFTDRFSSVVQKMEDDIDEMKNTLLKLEKGVTRDDCIAHIYGSNNSLRKTDIQKVFDVLEKLDKSSFSIEEKARVIRAFDSDLNMKPTKEILRAIEERAE